MKLNDPFGRMQARHQKGYEAMRTALREADVTTPQAARELIRQAVRRALAMLAIGGVLLVPVSALFPRFAPLGLGLGLFLAVWVVTSTLNGRRYITRYIDEELGE